MLVLVKRNLLEVPDTAVLLYQNGWGAVFLFCCRVVVHGETKLNVKLQKWFVRRTQHRGRLLAKN
mgnify:CR=1 FL=1